MKIKNFDKISGYTYKGFSIVNPIHNADETKYEATILNLNSPQKPKWELTVLTPAHKFKMDDTFSIILKDDENRSTVSTLHKERMQSIAYFRCTFEEMIDKLLSMRLTSAGVTASSHSIHSGYNKTINPKLYTTNTIGGIVNHINNSGTVSIYDPTSGTSINLIDTIKGLQQQIEDLKLQQNGSI
jgi:hypothetical protein